MQVVAADTLGEALRQKHALKGEFEMLDLSNHARQSERACVPAGLTLKAPTTEFPPESPSPPSRLLSIPPSFATYFQHSARPYLSEANTTPLSCSIMASGTEKCSLRTSKKKPKPVRHTGIGDYFSGENTWAENTEAADVSFLYFRVSRCLGLSCTYWLIC